MGTSIFRELYVLANGAEPCDVRPAWVDGDVVIRCPVEKPDGPVADVSIIHEGGVAWGVEGHVRRERDISGPVHALKPSEARIEDCLTATREPHDGNSGGVDARVLR